VGGVPTWAPLSLICRSRPEISLPNIKAAEKWVLQSEKRRLRNLNAKTRLKTLVKKARTGGDAEAVSLAESQLDKAATKGIIHPNKAARKKSRLARAVRAAANGTAAPAARSSRAGKKR
jgi:small subunit ribosomal protein S20